MRETSSEAEEEVEGDGEDAPKKTSTERKVQCRANSCGEQCATRYAKPRVPSEGQR